MRLYRRQAKRSEQTAHQTRGEQSERAVPNRRGERSEQAPPAKFAKRTSHSGEVREADEPRGIPPPLGRAEQRSSVRIKALALFERSEFASAPNAASSARNPKGTDVARLFLLTFFGEAKKVSRPPGRDPASHRRKTQPAQPNTLSPRPRATTRVAPTPSPLTKARHAVPLRPNSSLLRPNSSLLTPTP